MADESLRIRIDVNTATLRELTEEMKRLKGLMADAAQTDVPGLNAQYQQLSNQVRGLTSRHSEFGAQVREARTEARTFRFALLELTHGLDGLATTFSVLTGSGEKAKEGFKVVTDGAKEALAAGLGLKFGLEALGGSFAAFATPVALVVGGLTLVASGVAAVNKSMNDGVAEIEKNALEMAKLDEALALLLKDMKIISEEQYLDKMNASLDELTKQANEATKAVFSLNIIKTLTSGFAVFDVSQEKKTPAERQKEAIAVAEAVKKQHDEIIKSSKEGATAVALFDDSIRAQDELFLDSGKKKEKAEKDTQKELIEARKYLADLSSGLIIDQVGKEIETEDRKHEAIVAQLKQDREDLPALRKQINVALEAENDRHLTAIRLKREEAALTPQGAPAPTPKSLNEELGDWMAGIDVLQTGFSALSSSIHQGLANAFGAAGSMFQQFVLGVLDGITSIAEKIASSAIIAGIFSIFTGGFGSLFAALSGFHFAGGGMITEPVVGVGLHSGAGYSFGERAPERVSPLTSFGDSGGGYNRIEIVGSTRIAGRDLLQSWKETRIIDRKSGGNI